ncbi:MAG: class II aldolase/adducin family protein [Eubacterium sp.]|nr:class II aldolase/adducin family protein [Eubacterium sp.]
MYEAIKQEMLDAALEMKRNNLITLAGGNVSVRMPNGDIIITASGMNYEDMTTDDFIVFDKDKNIIEGTRRTSVDTPALFHIYDNMPNVNAILHTHQPYATAVGLISDELPACLTTLANTTLGAVNVAPYAPPGNLSMGELTVDYIGERLAVILKHHGVIAVGEDLHQALYAAVYLEISAQTYLAAAAVKEPALLTKEQNDECAEIFKRVGQK